MLRYRAEREKMISKIEKALLKGIRRTPIAPKVEQRVAVRRWDTLSHHEKVVINTSITGQHFWTE